MTKPYSVLKNKTTLLLSCVFMASSCALTVPIYEETSSSRIHFPYEPETLNCVQLSQQVIRVQNQLSDIASRVTEQADRSTASFSAGVTTNNPKRGTNFIGFQSSAVDPSVVEFQDGLLLLEELQVLLVDKCSQSDWGWSDQPAPKG
tara:strand:- start:154 stop:594 length:441 start_codon:yes stop_codon:yes gene_type:complete